MLIRSESRFAIRRLRGRTPEFYLIVSNISNREKRTIERGETVLKYREVIGRAARDMSSGTHGHIQNVEDLKGRSDLKS